MIVRRIVVFYFLEILYVCLNTIKNIKHSILDYFLIKNNSEIIDILFIFFFFLVIVIRKTLIGPYYYNAVIIYINPQNNTF